MENNPKMTVCKTCNNPIAANAKSCPACGAKNKKPFYKAPWFIVLAVLVVIIAIASVGSNGNADSQGSGSADSTQSQNNLGDFRVDIVSCRLAKTYDGKPAVIVKYKFTNNADEAKSFMWTFEDQVYQNGIGLNSTIMLDDSANYSSDNQTKEIKPGATIEVEVAYELNDETTDIEVEVKELVSWDDQVVKKTFSIK